MSRRSGRREFENGGRHLALSRRQRSRRRSLVGGSGAAAHRSGARGAATSASSASRRCCRRITVGCRQSRGASWGSNPSSLRNGGGAVLQGVALKKGREGQYERQRLLRTLQDRGAP